jgi:glycosyltransferase involved in cell wall biosynthesis
MATPRPPANLTENALILRKMPTQGFDNNPARGSQSLSRRSDPLRVAVVGNHLPRQCGIATFTTDLCNAICDEYGPDGLFVVAVNDSQAPYSYPARVRFEITEGDVESYEAAADFLNSSNIDLVCLQHEYGIFGGKCGSHVLRLLQRVNAPVVTTLHTVLREPNVDQLVVMQTIAERSDRLIVMSEHSSQFLREVFRVPEKKIELIPHGIPNLPFAEAKSYRVSHSGEDVTVLLTFGLLSPSKGLEYVIQALPSILVRHPNVAYHIVGATHPHIRRREGDRYRLQLEALAKELGVQASVVFHNRFVSPQEMASMVGSADIYITPYPREEQAVSGTLAYALGAGKAIISTPYWHAAELLRNGRGVLVPFKDPGAIAEMVIELLDNNEACQAMRERAYAYARKMVWSQVAQSYMRTFMDASSRMKSVRGAHPLQAVENNAAGRLANV